MISMDPARWERIQELFHRVVDLDADAQRRALELACVDDPTLLDEVLQMLTRDRNAPALLDTPLNAVADGVLSTKSPYADTHRRVGAYEIQRVLGEGGMGTVFFAVRQDLGTPAAIKILRDSWISPARRERFAREQYLLARLDHPNIARLLDASTLEDGTPYFVMEFVDGLHLDLYCESQSATIRERLRLFRAVCEAVHFAHQHAVIHRDLKPSNVLVKADGVVKLLDFGIARQLDDFYPASDVTKTGLRLMTPAFASPEQIRGEPAAVGNDVYSLGVILYRLITGRLPFDELNDRSDMGAIAVGRNVVRPSLVARRVAAKVDSAVAMAPASDSDWAELDVICLKAMHNDVGQRYGSVEGLLRDIDHFLKGEPLEARPDSLSYRARKFVRRRRAAVASAALALLAVFLLVTFFLTRLAAERNTVLAEAARTQRIQQFLRNLFQGGDTDAGPAKDLPVTALLDRGVLEARALDKDPVTQAELFQTLGDIYQKLGNLERANELFTAALDRRRGTSASPTVAEAEVIASLALLRAEQAQMAEAEKLARQALSMGRAVAPEGHPLIATSSEALGHVLSEKGAYSEAIPILEETVRLRSDSRRYSASDLAGSLYELGNAYFYAGRYKDSERVNQRVLRMNQEIYGARHPRVADALVNLGAIQQDLGNYAEAERFQRQALEITRAFFGDTHHRTAAGFTMVARSLVFQSKFDEATAFLQQALSVQERVFGPVHPRVASALNELGTVALQRGNVAEAKKDFSRMAEIYRSVYDGKHYLMGTALSNLASAYLAGKEHERAEALFREAVAIFTRAQSAEHLNTAIARMKLGRTLLRQRRFDEAEAEVSAGFRILRAQVNPSVSWLNSARKDLVEIYESLGRPEKAGEFRAQLASAGK
jgi:serine/threonine-protein kinase